MDATTLAQTMSLKAHTDTLTGILNRRGLDSRLEKVANNIQFD
jgi:GGDEF domain-containing protein